MITYFLTVSTVLGVRRLAKLICFSLCMITPNQKFREIRSRIYFDNAADNVTLTLHNSRHRNPVNTSTSVIAAKQTVRNEVYVVVVVFFFNKISLRLSLKVPWVCLQSVIVAFSKHTHLLLDLCFQRTYFYPPRTSYNNYNLIGWILGILAGNKNRVSVFDYTMNLK